MYYNREFFLNRIVEIQNITIKYSGIGVTQERIFKDHIKSQYGISRRTYYRYLETNAKKLLKIN